MIQLGRRIAGEAGSYRGTGHPLEITHELAAHYASLADEITEAEDLAEPMPRLAQLVAASPVEAAIHDAYGKALGANSYNLLGAEFVNRDLAGYLTAEFAGEYLDRYTLREPKPRMPLYHLVGALDPLTDSDLGRRIDDGLPETLPEWIAADGLTHLKIKLNGDDLAWDVDRVVAIERVAAEAQAARGCRDWCYSADFNEKCANVEYVLDFLGRLAERSPPALARLQYIEQPTSRDLRANPENRMHAAAQDQAGGDRRIAGRLREPALEPRAGVFGRGVEGLQGPQRGPVDGGRRAEVRDVPLRAGPDLPGLFVLALGQPFRPDSYGRGHRRQRPAVLPRGQRRLERAIPVDVPRH